MSQSPLTRQVLNNAPSNSPTGSPKITPRVSIRKPAKRIVMNKQTADSAAAANADDDEPQLIMSPVVASVNVTAGDDSDDELPSLAPPKPIDYSSSPTVTVQPLSSGSSPTPAAESPAAAPKISLRRGSLHQNTAQASAGNTSPMITLAPRKDEDEAAVIIAEAAPAGGNDSNQGSATPTAADNSPTTAADKSKVMRLKKKSDAAPLAFLKTLPSAMNEAMKKEPTAQQQQQQSNSSVRGPDSPVIGGAKSVAFEDKSSYRKSSSGVAVTNAANSPQLGGNRDSGNSSSITSSLNIPENATSVLHLSEAERKELYPSDDDEDFDNYLFDMMQGRELDDDNDDKSSTPSNKLTETSLKFTEFIKNPLYDPTAPPVKEVVIHLTRDDVIRLNEVARRARERGDIHYKNYKLIDKLDKDLFKEYKSKLMTRRLSTMVRRSEKNTPINLKDIKELEDLRRGSVEASGFTFNDDEVVQGAKGGKYDIRQCSRSWKTQLKNLQVVTTSSSNNNNGNATEADKKAEEPKKKISSFLPPHFSSHASIMKQGYMPEWKYALHTKRLMDASKNVSTKA